MALYEFSCVSCGARFEELVTGSAEGVKCPRCGAANVKKLLSTFGYNSGSSFKSSSISSGGCTSCGGGSCSTCGH
ncbi:MAG: zinc ribbon domain-containing protein [Firmicutes bacterium]|nr:zinc ribbon domain-containing protein [Bacillota bacterium]